MSRLWTYGLGPKLIYCYKWKDGTKSHPYNRRSSELYADRSIAIAPTLASLPPLWLLWQHDLVVNSSTLWYYYGILTTVMAVAFISRAYGRTNNSDYQRFMTAWTNRKIHTRNRWIRKPIIQKSELDLFDYDFQSKFVDYKAVSPMQSVPVSDKNLGPISSVLAVIFATILGRPLIYPGSTWLMKTLLRDLVSRERANLIEQERGVRCKIETINNLAIDCMYYDRREVSPREKSSKVGCRNPEFGKTLVVTCEGNASFYEAGVGVTPIQLGYSVLDWNHPGFMNSEGMPYPENDAGAVASIIEFALVQLGWDESDIIIYAWSIGGYSASRAVSEYPRVKGLILDATFDHVLPLALARMPRALQSIVDSTISSQLNLDVVTGVKNYCGPVLFVRRRQDEMITAKTGDISTNRGNFLIVDILEYRYPHITQRDYLLALLAHSDPIMVPEIADEKVIVFLEMISNWLYEDSEYRQEAWIKFLRESTSQLDVKQRALVNKWMLSRHLVDLNSKHCAPYPLSRWREPTFRRKDCLSTK
eukprot:CFRG1163T1